MGYFDKTYGCTFLRFLFCFCELEMFQFYKMTLAEGVACAKAQGRKDLTAEEAGEARSGPGGQPSTACLWLQAALIFPWGQGKGCRAPVQALPGVRVSAAGLWGAGVNPGEGPLGEAALG